MQQNNRYRKTNSEKPRNESFILPVCNYGRLPNKAEYSYDSFSELLNSLFADGIFTVLSFPCSMYRTDTTNDKERDAQRKGTIPVGFVKGMTDPNTMEVVVFSNYADYVKTLKDPMIFPRVIASRDDKSAVNTILGFDICERAKYDYLLTDEEA